MKPTPQLGEKIFFFPPKGVGETAHRMFEHFARFISLQAPGGSTPSSKITGTSTNGHGSRPAGEVSRSVSSSVCTCEPEKNIVRFPSLLGASPPSVLPSRLPQSEQHVAVEALQSGHPHGVSLSRVCRQRLVLCANVVPVVCAAPDAPAPKHSLCAVCLRSIRLRAPAALMSTSRQ